MQKWFQTVLFAVILSIGLGLSACAVQPAPNLCQEPVLSLEELVTVTVKDQKIDCSLSHLPQGLTTIKVISSESDNGFSFCWDESGFSMQYEGLMVKQEEESLPEGCFARLLKRVLQAASVQGSLVREENNTFSGITERGEQFLLTVEENGRILEVLVPEYSFTAKMKETSV